jgi:hypothetical protein
METSRETLSISPNYAGEVERNLVAHIGITQVLSPIEYLYIASEYQEKLDKIQEMMEMYKTLEQ